MNAGERDRDDLLAELLVMVDEQLADGTVGGSVDTSGIVEPDDLPPEWERGRRCLELLHRVRLEWSPDDGIQTPLPDAGSALPETPHDPAGTLLGRFRILRELGHGGLGIVYLAHDPKLHRQVALKVPRLQALASRDLRSRFLREAKAAARLSHPHLVSIYDAGEDGQICFIAAEYCPGPTLSGWLKERPTPVPTHLAARIVKQLAEAVEHAHRRGVLHRDIKPSNVMMCPSDDTHPGTATSGPNEMENLTPKLTDFGMAKLLESVGDETRTGALLGTPAYMAPEQARGEIHAVDERADVYALGAVLYEVLTGSRTFPSESEVGALHRVLLEEPEAPRKLRREIPRDLETICLKALNKNARDRYQTAGDMAADLGRFLADEPIVARRVHPIEKGWRWLKRRPLVAAVLIMVIVAAVALESARRVSRENYALQGFREVKFTTEPPGAELAIVRLNEQTAEPDPSQVTRPSERTPLTVSLKPGDYLIVAALDKQRFHEVYRHVPSPDQRAGGHPHGDADVDRHGTVLIPKIQIPETVETQDMVVIECPKLASANQRQRGDSPRIYVDCNKLTVDDLPPELGSLSLDDMKRNYDTAVRIAEVLGKRLPSEAEFECMADSYSAAKEGAALPVYSGTRNAKHPGDLQNLFNGKGEWTTSSRPNGSRGYFADSPESRVVRGVASNTSTGVVGTDTRHGHILVNRSEDRPDIGFRCVRSPAPRFLDY